MLSRLLCKPRFLIFVLFVSFLLILISRNYFVFRNTLSYATRPIWDKPLGFSQVIPHYYGENVPTDTLCHLHNWDVRDSHTGTVVFDAMLMNNELDLLEIRLNELDSVVDYFVILESNVTFTGLPKQTYFADNRERYSEFNHKILYQLYVPFWSLILRFNNCIFSLPGYPLQPDKTAWDTEATTRNTMTKFLRSYINEFTVNATNLVIMSDVDEIPSQHTLALLKTCDFGNSIHLQMRTYLYRYGNVS